MFPIPWKINQLFSCKLTVDKVSALSITKFKVEPKLMFWILFYNPREVLAFLNINFLLNEFHKSFLNIFYNCENNVNIT
ncbi:hypothetical protein HNR33_001874 [Brassicibacter mesophilus]